MDANTGRTYPFPEGFGPVEVGSALAPMQPLLEKLEREADEAEQRDRARELDEALRRGDPIVAVSGDVVQRLRLGDRELERRRRRRR